MSQTPIKRCSNCNKVYLAGLPGEVCPFCGYDENVKNIFKDIFGDDNPFSNMGVN